MEIFDLFPEATLWSGQNKIKDNEEIAVAVGSPESTILVSRAVDDKLNLVDIFIDELPLQEYTAICNFFAEISLLPYLKRFQAAFEPNNLAASAYVQCVCDLLIKESMNIVEFTLSRHVCDLLNGQNQYLTQRLIYTLKHSKCQYVAVTETELISRQLPEKIDIVLQILRAIRYNPYIQAFAWNFLYARYEYFSETDDELLGRFFDEIAKLLIIKRTFVYESMHFFDVLGNIWPTIYPLKFIRTHVFSFSSEYSFDINQIQVLIEIIRRATELEYFAINNPIRKNVFFHHTIQNFWYAVMESNIKHFFINVLPGQKIWKKFVLDIIEYQYGMQTLKFTLSESSFHAGGYFDYIDAMIRKFKQHEIEIGVIEESSLLDIVKYELCDYLKLVPFTCTVDFVIDVETRKICVNKEEIRKKFPDFDYWKDYAEERKIIFNCLNEQLF